MSYNLCFICSEQIRGYFEFSKKKSTTAGTLCEVLELPLRDSTFSFGQKFLQAPFCLKCVKDMREIRDLLSNLKQLEGKIRDKKMHIRNLLRESCQNRKRIATESSKDGGQDEDQSGLEQFDLFREDVVKEINSAESSVYSRPISENKLPERKRIRISLSLPKKSNTTSPKKNPNTKSGEKTKSNDTPQQDAQSIPTVTESQNQSVSGLGQTGNAGPSEVTPSTSTTVAGIGIGVPISDTGHPHFGHSEYDYQNQQQIEAGAHPNLGYDFFSGWNASSASAGFVSMLGSTNQINVQFDNPDSGAEQHVPSDSEICFVNLNHSGQLQCPYAPNCPAIFNQTEKEQFVRHVREGHKQQPESQGQSQKKKITRNPRTGYDMKFKLDAALYAVKHGSEAAAKHFSVDSRRIREWRQQIPALEAAVAEREILARTPKQPKKMLRLPGGGRKPQPPKS